MDDRSLYQGPIYTNGVRAIILIQDYDLQIVSQNLQRSRLYFHFTRQGKEPWTRSMSNERKVKIYVSTEVLRVSAGNDNLSKETFLYPIPAKNVLSIRDIEAYSDIKILNLSGQVLFHEKIKSLYEIQIDIASLPAGIFFVMLNAEDKRAVEMFVKTREVSY